VRQRGGKFKTVVVDQWDLTYPPTAEIVSNSDDGRFLKRLGLPPLGERSFADLGLLHRPKVMQFLS
jgi:hypothetical protein